MRRSSSRDASDRVGMGVSPVTVDTTDIGPKLQEAQFSLPGGGQASSVAIQYPYGFAARVKAPSKDDSGAQRAAETHILTAAGNRSHGVALPPSDRRFPCPVKLEEGEVCHFDANGSYTLFKADGSTVHQAKAGQTTTHGADGTITHKVGNVTFKIGSEGLDITGGYIKHNGKRIDATHKHGGIERGGSQTDEPA